MSTTLLGRTPHPLPTEVIDVDLIEDGSLALPPSRRRRIDTDSWTSVGPSSGSTSGRGMSSGSVIVIDSDEEDITELPSSSSRRLRSPPPPLRNSVPPPVPPLPPPPPPFHSQGVIRPDDNAFLRNLGARLGRRQSSAHNRHPPTPSVHSSTPRSRYTPSMGLGGAILSVFERSSQSQRALREASERRWEERMQRTIGQPHGSWGFLGAGTSNDDDYDDWYSGTFSNFATFGLSFDFLGGSSSNSAWSNTAPRAPRPSYMVEYTHKDVRPSPGFTYDFDPSEVEREAARRRKIEAGVTILDESGEVEVEEASSSTVSGGYNPNESSTLLICAGCGDPLIRGVGGQRRIWALRCGHMLDGKCVDALMKPDEALSIDVVPTLADISTTSSPVDIKGKGKAVVATGEEGEGTFATNYVRSRLRPRKQSGPSTDPKTSRSVTARTIAARKGRRARSSKGKGRAVAPRVLKEHSWECPVIGCHRLHLSEQLEGGEGREGEVYWAHREGQGPLQVFA